MHKFDLHIFQRITSSGRYVPVVDGIRFIAITWVVFFHINIYLSNKTPIDAAPQGELFQILRWIMSVGNIGVPIFFSLSDYILAQSYQSFLERSADGLQRYYLRRLTRLEPPYLISMAILAFAGILSGKFAFDRNLIESLGASVFYLHDLIFGHWSLVNGVAWSLEIEAQFYLLAPLIFTVLKIPHATARRLVLAAGILACSAVSCYLPLNRRALHMFLQFFLIGVLFYDISKNTKVTIDLRRPYAWLLLGLILFGLAASRWNVSESGHFTAPWLILALFFAVFGVRDLTNVLSYPPTARIGGMCYSIYLLHYPLISLAGKLTSRFWWPNFPVFSFVMNAIMMAVFVLLFSGGFFLLIERPTMDPSWPSRLKGILCRERTKQI